MKALLIDYGSGNLRSAAKALEAAGFLKEITRVTHITANGGITPTHLEGVEAQVQSDQLGRVLNELLPVSERVQPLARHLRAHDIVKSKGHSLRRRDLTGGRFTDVVQ